MKKFKSAFSLTEISFVIIIVGILLVGISRGIDLYDDYKITSARNLTINSRVGRIPDLSLWLETTNEKSFQNSSDSYNMKDGDSIKTWNDINPSNTKKFVASQTNLSLQPIYKKNGIGGLPTILFDANATATTGNGLAIPFDRSLNTPDLTIFTVTKHIEATSGWGNILISSEPNPNPKGFMLRKNSVNSQFSFSFFDGSAWRATVQNNFIFNKPMITSIICGRTYCRMYENSIFKAGNSYSIGESNAVNNLRDFLIGHDYAGNINFFDGNISEIIYYGRHLNDSERVAVEEYLLKKYNINKS